MARTAVAAKVTNIFLPKGDQAQWRPVYDHLITMEIGDLLTYDRLRRLLPGMDLDRARLVFHYAKRHVLQEHQRAFENVRGEGYRMVHPREQGGLATNHQRRARRQIRKARALVENVDESRLTREERRKLEELSNHYLRLDGMMKGISERQDHTEKTQLAMADQLETLNDAVVKMQAAMRRHNIEFTG